MNDKEKKLFKAQKKYALDNKEQIFGRFYGKKVGFDLNIVPHFCYLLEFELRKKYSEVSPFVISESFLTTHFSDLLDSAWVLEGDDYSLKESMENEAELSVISKFLLKNRKNKIYPSQMLRKERVIQNQVKRARKVIDNFFSERDILFSEISDVIDIFECVIEDRGAVVDIHAGSFGFSLTGDTSPKDILDYCQKERKLITVKKEIVDKTYAIQKKLVKEALSLGVLSKENFKKTAFLTFSDYEIKSKPIAYFEHKKEELQKNISLLLSFLDHLKNENFSLPKDSVIKDGFQKISYKNFSFDLTEANILSFISQMKNYLSFEKNIDTLYEAVKKDNFITDVYVKGNHLFISAQEKEAHALYLLEDFLNNIEEIDIEELGTEETAEMTPLEMPERSLKRKTTLTFILKEDGVYRLSGEKVLTNDVIVFEMMESIRQSHNQYILTMETAKEMLLSTLTEEEEELFLEKQMTFIEGKENFYALVDKSTYNNVIKIPKNAKSAYDIKALCIHPDNRNIPRYDGFAAITLAVKSGDEKYVLENSNEFSLSHSMFKKIKEMIPSLDSMKHLNFA